MVEFIFFPESDAFYFYKVPVEHTFLTQTKKQQHYIQKHHTMILFISSSMSNMIFTYNFAQA